jgi:hypothetical protein
MDTPSLSTRACARRLLAAEAANQCASAAHGHAAVRVCEKLRMALGKFAGPEGFAALLRRALALARADAPALEAVKITANGRLQGLEEIAEGDNGDEAASQIIARLLGLLDTFIGPSLTLRLVRNAWPDASLDG